MFAFGPQIWIFRKENGGCVADDLHRNGQTVICNLWLLRHSLWNIQWLHSYFDCHNIWGKKKKAPPHFESTAEAILIKKNKKTLPLFFLLTRRTHTYKKGIETSARRQRENLQLWRDAASIWGLIMCVMSSPSCVRAPALAVPAAAPHTHPHTHTPAPPNALRLPPPSEHPPPN